MQYTNLFINSVLLSSIQYNIFIFKYHKAETTIQCIYLIQGLTDLKLTASEVKVIS